MAIDPQALPNAQMFYRAGKLGEAKRTLAAWVSACLSADPKAVVDDISPDALALSLQIDLAMGLTGAGERALGFLDAREAAIAAGFAQQLGRGRSSRDFRYPRQPRRLVLAATGRLAEALASVEAAGAGEAPYRFEGPATRLQTEISVRAASHHDVAHYGSQWIAERKGGVRVDEQTRPTTAEDARNIEDLLLLASIHLARAELHRMRKRGHLKAAREDASAAVELAERFDHPLLAFEARLLLGRIALLSWRRKGATKKLEALRTEVAAIGHRDLESRVALTLAQLANRAGDDSRMRSCTKAAVALATSADGGPNLKPTLDAAFALLLESDASNLLDQSAAPGSHGETRGETVIVVHGTYAQPSSDTPQWFEKGSDFCTRLDARLEAQGSAARCWAHLDAGGREFFWSGANSWIDRSAAAASLAAYLATLAPRWRCHLVAHSHGGNVCHEALEILAQKHDGEPWDGHLVTLGTPYFHQAAETGLWTVVRAICLVLVAAVVVVGAVTLPWWVMLVALLSVPFVAVLIVLLGFGRFLLRGVSTGASRGSLLQPSWPRALAISCEEDEALQLLRLALEEPEPRWLSRLRRSFLARAPVLWAQSRALARARQSAVGFTLVWFVKACLIEIAGYRAGRLAWRFIRETACGLAGIRGGLGGVSVSPRPAVGGSATEEQYELLPTHLVDQALDERAQNVTSLDSWVRQSLDTRRWTLNGIEALLSGATLDNLVHGFYYRNPSCIRRVARWLARREPDDLMGAAILAEYEQELTLGSPPADPWVS